MKKTSRPPAPSRKKTQRPESNRRRLARLLKQIVAGEITFTSAAAMGDSLPRSLYRRTME